MDTGHARARLMREAGRLVALRTTLRDELAADASAPEATGPDHALEELLDLEQERTLLETVDREIEDVLAAFRRTEDGTYGRCLACGHVIPDERLEAVPAAAFCLAHEVAAEVAVASSTGTSRHDGEVDRSPNEPAGEMADPARDLPERTVSSEERAMHGIALH